MAHPEEGYPQPGAAPMPPVDTAPTQPAPAEAVDPATAYPEALARAGISPEIARSMGVSPDSPMQMMFLNMAVNVISSTNYNAGYAAASGELAQSATVAATSALARFATGSAVAAAGPVHVSEAVAVPDADNGARADAPAAEAEPDTRTELERAIDNVISGPVTMFVRRQDQRIVGLASVAGEVLADERLVLADLSNDAILKLGGKGRSEVLSLGLVPAGNGPENYLTIRDLCGKDEGVPDDHDPSDPNRLAVVLHYGAVNVPREGSYAHLRALVPYADALVIANAVGNTTGTARADQHPEVARSIIMKYVENRIAGIDRDKDPSGYANAVAVHNNLRWLWETSFRDGSVVKVSNHGSLGNVNGDKISGNDKTKQNFKADLK